MAKKQKTNENCEKLNSEHVAIDEYKVIENECKAQSQQKRGYWFW